MQANTNINGKTLILEPRTSPNGDVIWNCGCKAPGRDPRWPPSGAAGSTSTITPEVPAERLPRLIGGT